MFVMGTRVSPAALRQVAATPGVVAIGLGLQWLIMPLTAALLAAAFGLPAEIGAGVILVGSVCAGNSSNVMTFFAGGNMALSVTMTTLSTLLSPLTTPAFMSLLAGRAVPVAFQEMAWSVARIVVAPVLAGILCERFLRSRQSAADRWITWTVTLATCLVNAIIVANAQKALLAVGPALAAVEILHNLIGYAGGYAGGRLFRLDHRDCVTMAMQVGIRNGGLATGLAYDVLKSGNAALGGVVFGTIQNATGALAATLLRYVRTSNR
jgi:BASS family bile acid:Na+ symporter